MLAVSTIEGSIYAAIVSFPLGIARTLTHFAGIDAINHADSHFDDTLRRLAARKTQLVEIR